MFHVRLRIEILLTATPTESKVCNCEGECRLVALKDQLQARPVAHFVVALLREKYLPNSEQRVSTILLFTRTIHRMNRIPVEGNNENEPITYI